MRSRTLFALAIPLLAAGLFVRLGVWQLQRHAERATTNEALLARLAMPPIAFDSLRGDTLATRWRRVSLAGRFRYDLEQVQAGRTSEGSPGVHLLTPLELPGHDTLVIVTRGWVYSANASGVDLARWRERDTVTLDGYTLPLEPMGAAPDSGRPFRNLSAPGLSARIGRPVAPLRVVMTSDSAARIDSVPRRLPPPAIDPGPHRSYALQWFAFAIIALAGGVILFRRGIVADSTRG
jgi:surfeit locus 1 family protein